ncbi:putative colanic acid biosynthesis acetyltransferase [Rhodoferax sp. BLA1]|uniref:putative colanic acid biosynthesis acetyltransferase n=1 Tax=Rhodoferax sp. BLA1 TaxID=2576062 RepID=UPI0015D227BE|nr:putative colanic acid biosynthesis acetyltransferase [Rhodoferax sp. BLA1]
MIDLSKSKTRWGWQSQIARGLWTFVAEPLVRWLPKSCSFIRIFFLRVFGARIGKNCLVMPGVKVLMPWNLELDEFVAIGHSVDLYNFALIRIRRMSVVSQRCYLCTGSHDYSDQAMPLTFKPISIGSECWVAAEAFIAPGVTIADGVVVGARAVVTRSINTPWSVWAGHPAKLIKARQMKDVHDT